MPLDDCQEKRLIPYYTMVIKGETGQPPMSIYELVSTVHNIPRIIASLMDYKYYLNNVCRKIVQNELKLIIHWQ